MHGAGHTAIRHGAIRVPALRQRLSPCQPPASSAVPLALHVDKLTQDDETVIRLLTNLPGERFSARAIARLYRRRWQIASRFQRRESVSHSEMPTPGHPRAALLAFGGAGL